jgi:hypothetical protein
VEVVDISLSGMLIASGLDLGVHDTVDIKLLVGDEECQIKGTIVHKNSENRNGICINNIERHPKFRGLVVPLLVGSSLKEFDKDDVNQSEPSYLKRVFFGSLNSSLTLWCDKSNPEKFCSFELILDEVTILGENNNLRFFELKEEENDSFSKVDRSKVLSEILDEERKIECLNFYKWAVSSMNSATKVRGDLLTFLPLDVAS